MGEAMEEDDHFDRGTIAVALDVEHAWGEEFTANLLELLQFDQAYSVKTPKISLPDMDDDIIKLNIDPRK
jgi:hypothetical protein